MPIKGLGTYADPALPLIFSEEDLAETKDYYTEKGEVVKVGKRLPVHYEFDANGNPVFCEVIVENDEGKRIIKENPDFKVLDSKITPKDWVEMQTGMKLSEKKPRGVRGSASVSV